MVSDRIMQINKNDVVDTLSFLFVFLPATEPQTLLAQLRLEDGKATVAGDDSGPTNGAALGDTRVVLGNMGIKSL